MTLQQSGRSKVRSCRSRRAAVVGRTLPIDRVRVNGWNRREAVIEQTQTLIGAPPNSTPSTSPLVRVGFGSQAVKL